MKTLVLAVQWVLFHSGVVISAPVILGAALKLDAAGTGALMQTTFLLTGAGSLVQVFLGHRECLVEGPAAPWWMAYIVLAGLAVVVGKPIEVLRTDIGGAMLLTGLVMVILGLIGVIRRCYWMFTHRVVGVLLLLLGIQIGSVGFRGMVSSGTAGFLLSLAVLGLILALLFRARGFVSRAALLIGVGVGWAAAILLGLATIGASGTSAWFALPSPFPWGRPTFDLTSILALVILGLLLVPNVLGSIKAMEAATGKAVPLERHDAGLSASGLCCLAAGAFGGSGTIPFAISAGLVSVSGEESRRPFVVAGLLMVGLGLVVPLGRLLGGIPVWIAGTVLVVSVGSLIVIGIKNIAQDKIEKRETYIIGTSIIAGLGTMLMPPEFWRQVPSAIAGIVSNGAIVGTTSAMLLEHIVFPRRSA